MNFINRMIVENYAMSVGTTATGGIGSYGNMDLPIATSKRKIREDDTDIEVKTDE